MRTQAKPRPRCSAETLEHLQQVEIAIRFWESEGELKHLIMAMAEKEELLKQAFQESRNWARTNTPVSV